MNEQFTQSLNALAAHWWELATAVAWQATLLVVVAVLLCWMLRRQAPAIRCGAWTLVAAKLLVMPWWSYSVEVPGWKPPSKTPAAPQMEPSISIAPVALTLPLDSPEAPLVGANSVVTAHESQTGPRLAWQASLFLSWSVVVMLQLLRILLQGRNLRKLLVRSESADGELMAVVERLSRTAGLRRTPQVAVAADDISPLVCRAWRPVLVLPQQLLAEIEPTALRQIVLHELAHIRRGDLWWCWLPHLARVVYWFHPLAHWVAYQASLERELACDAAAIRAEGATVGEYARTLINAARRVVPLPALEAAASQSAERGTQHA